MKALDYVPAPVAFVALLVSVGGSSFSWDSVQRQLTPLGWTAIALGSLALAGSLFLTWRQHRDLDLQRRQRDQVRAIAHAETRLAVGQITWPFFSLFGDESEESFLQLAPPHIEDAERLTKVMQIEVRSQTPGLSGGTFGISWAEVLKRNADSGAARIDRVMQIYAAYLEPEVLEALSELRTCEFLVLRLQRLDEHVEENAQIAFLHFPFPSPPEINDRFGSGFLSFWTIVRRLDQRLLREPARLRRRL